MIKQKEEENKKLQDKISQQKKLFKEQEER